MTSSTVIVLTGGLAGAVALGLTSWLRTLAGMRSRGLDRGVHVVLAALGGGAAAALAEQWLELAALALLAVACAALVVIDLATCRLPDAIVGPTYPLLFGLLLTAAAVAGDWDRLLRAVAGAGLTVLVYLVLALIRPDLGLGDVKLSGLLGAFLAWLGWWQLVYGTLAGFVLAGTYAAGLLVTRRATRRSDIPFGPWMVLGAVVGAVVGALGVPGGR
ncbi:MAG: prepilin peptidase [Actinomycetes bacterium]